MRRQLTQVIAALGLMLSAGCLSLGARMTALDLNRGRHGVYPSVSMAGRLIGTEPLNPLAYLLVAVDLPLSLILDTLFLPTDLSHPPATDVLANPPTR
jgi:uncharacterized protein YceK